MKHLKSENGIALITALMFTVLSLVISMALLYMVTAGAKTSGSLKRYKTAMDATYGGTELITKEMIGKALAFTNFSASGTSFRTYFLDPNQRGSLNILSESNLECLHERLSTPKRFWSSACSVISSSSPDISFRLNSTETDTNKQFRVYSNIVDTSEWRITSFPGTAMKVTNSLAGNSDVTSGEESELTQGGVVKTGTPLKTPHYPFVYKIEIQGERQNNPAMEKGNMSVLYAY
jgi:hypothetical protein